MANCLSTWWSSSQQLLQPDSAIVTVCAFWLRPAQTAPIYASQVKQMLGGLRFRGAKKRREYGNQCT